MRKTGILLIIFAMLAICTIPVFSKEYKCAVGKLSPMSIETFTKLSIALVEATGNTVAIEVLPPARGIYSIQTKEKDFYTATIALTDIKKISELPYDYSTADSNYVVMVLYTNKNKRITPTMLMKGNPDNYKIETDTSLVNYFDFTTIASSASDLSLKKIDSNRVDGYIFSQPTTDPILKNLGLKNIKRQYYKTFNGKFILAKGAKDGDVDKMLTAGMKIIKANGKYNEIMGKLISAGYKYNDWQQ